MQLDVQHAPRPVKILELDGAPHRQRGRKVSWDRDTPALQLVVQFAYRPEKFCVRLAERHGRIDGVDGFGLDQTEAKIVGEPRGLAVVPMSVTVVTILHVVVWQRYVAKVVTYYGRLTGAKGDVLVKGVTEPEQMSQMTILPLRDGERATSRCGHGSRVASQRKHRPARHGVIHDGGLQVAV